jgi:hypothetical protein
MAIMIPDEAPSEKQSVYSENQVWKELKLQLSDDFFVYHSLPYLTQNARQGEVDFLVVHPELGMLNIECKGGGVSRSENGRWYRTGRYGKRERMRPPMDQAADQIRAVVNGLKEPLRRVLDTNFRDFPILYGWALIFPLAQRDDLNLPLDLQPEVVIDSHDIARDLEAKVIEAFDFRARIFRGDPPGLGKEEFARLRSVICPPVEFPETMAGRIALDKKAMWRLSKSQAHLIDGMVANRRLRIPGGAGTGKTVMAMHGARLLAEEGKHVLITCFNSKLRDFIARSVQGWPKLAGRVDVHHFHQLCAQAGRDVQGGLNYPSRDATRDERAKFWQDDAPFKIVRAVAEDKFSMGPWDAIFVDEAQDFAPTWWEVLEECLRDDASSMAIFYDEGQNIFDRATAIPEWPMVYRLSENFRNSKAIARAIQPLCDTPIKAHPDCVDGEEPTVFQQPGPTKTRQMLGELLDKLIGRQNIRPAQIAILTPHSPANSSLEGALELAGHPLVHAVEDWPTGVLHSSISGFKGLEADVVILVDIDPSDPRCSVNARYVAASRALHRLYVFEKSHWLARD